MAIRLIGIFVFFSTVVLGQTSTVSPFSSQGIGDVNFYGDPYFIGMGGITAPIADSTQANMFNPASYSFLSQGLPVFSLGISHEETEFRLNEQTSRDRFSNLTHMSLIIPFANRLGLAFGLQPLSRSGYEVNSFQIIGGDSIFYDYSGRGELQKFNLGFSVLLAKSLNHKLSIGANGFRYFGRLERESKAYQNQQQGNQSGAFERSFLQARDFGFDAGLIYKFTPSSNHSLTLGASYDMQQDVSFRRSRVRVQFNDFNFTNSYDTIQPLNVHEGSITLPQKIEVGFAYEYKTQRDTTRLRQRRRSSSFIISGQYSVEDWGSYSESFPTMNNLPTSTFFNSQSARFGMQYRPHRYVDRSNFVGFFKRVSYRLGAYYVETPYQNQGEQMVDVGATFGIGIPLVISGALSTVNLSVAAGQRGVLDRSDLLHERYLGINFGVNITPSYDRWFMKREIN